MGDRSVSAAAAAAGARERRVRKRERREEGGLTWGEGGDLEERSAAKAGDGF